ncbi:MAG: RNA polymerase sigma factor [Candidatus Merdivicinus sp.]|jgi:RNA polymerase sigma factor (sigma-70 family)
MDTLAFASEVEKNRRYYLYLARRYVKNPQDAEDVLGDAVCLGLSRLHQLRSDACFHGWMRKIVINCAASYLRNRRREDSLDALEDMGPQWAVVNEWEQTDQRMDLQRAVRARSPGEQQCIWLHGVYGFTFEEIAECYDLTASAVKSRWYRGLYRVRQAYRCGEG